MTRLQGSGVVVNDLGDEVVTAYRWLGYPNACLVIEVDREIATRQAWWAFAVTCSSDLRNHHWNFAVGRSFSESSLDAAHS